MKKERRLVFLAFAVVMVFGVAVYFRLWSVDYRMSSDEAQLLRREFDLANREAMDESADWRRMYDQEVERASMCIKELNNTKKRMMEENGANSYLNKRLELLQKENMDLLERVETLMQELEGEKLKCN
ncbi:uncharacterized protein LOC124942604 isoform X1 [Impatiens glandulifera]|uniref:uncharacterized protein LOC124942604 isoform X1 n=1 Tax=Impatiens glandulifera TaxID=253017 RepID=UPI001FB0F0DD|nr:uncharacterized protein LOC124942604 isoform X1 [Impatiens glandulifera]